MKKFILNILFLNTPVNTKFLAILLMLMFVDYAGYGYFVFYMSFAYLLFHKSFKIDIDAVFLLLLAWGTCYGVTIILNISDLSYVTILVPMINCPILYLLGKYIACHNDEKGLIVLLYLFAFSVAFISILSVCVDVAKNGFLVMGYGRNVPLIGIDNVEGYAAATGISSRLILLTSFFVFIMLPYSWPKKVIFVFGAFLAIYCAVRIQSRTTIVSLALIFSTMVIGGLKSLPKKQKCLLLLGMVGIVYIILYILGHYSDELVIIDRFQADEIETGGGRLERLLNVVSLMWSYPFGGMGKDIEYAHNLWFDCARVAGIIPFMLLIIIALVYIRYLFKIARNKSIDLILRNIFWILSLAILMVFLAEPVLEGIPMVFEFFCFLFGIMHCYAKFRLAP